jgi:hypothetical protein
MAMTRLAGILLLLVTVDFSNPLLPGSVRLDPGESVAAVHPATSAARSVSSPILLQPVDRRDPARRPDAHQARRVGGAPVERGWTLGVRPARHDPDDRTAASPAEDH